MQESETLSPGQTINQFDTEFARIGLGICYDVRFPELAMTCARRGCHVLIYPGAFNTTTGPLHWELLQRARYATRFQKAHCRANEMDALQGGGQPGVLLYVQPCP